MRAARAAGLLREFVAAARARGLAVPAAGGRGEFPVPRDSVAGIRPRFFESR